MKKVFVKNIKEKEHVEGPFLVSKKESGISKTGKSYLNLRIMDSSGEAEARVWDNADALAKNFEKGDVANIRGFAVAYQGGLQVNITEIKKLEKGEYSVRDYLPSSQRTQEEMSAELDAIIGSVKDRYFKSLLEGVFKDPEIREKFLLSPAAKSMHHPYLGGLAEHVLSICGLADKAVAHYGAQSLDRDLLLSGALLHDIGKIFELSFNNSFEYTDEGRLLGHITMGIGLVDSKIAAIPDFPKEKALLLKHMLLSHHGHLEFGSPKRPKTIEAIMLYYLDDLDAKIKTVQTLLEGAKDSGAGWTAYQKLFERYIYLGNNKAVDAEPEAGPEQAQPASDNAPKNGKTGPLSLF